WWTWSAFRVGDDLAGVDGADPVARGGLHPPDVVDLRAAAVPDGEAGPDRQCAVLLAAARLVVRVGLGGDLARVVRPRAVEVREAHPVARGRLAPPVRPAVALDAGAVDDGGRLADVHGAHDGAAGRLADLGGAQRVLRVEADRLGDSPGGVGGELLADHAEEAAPVEVGARVAAAPGVGLAVA